MLFGSRAASPTRTASTWKIFYEAPRSKAPRYLCEILRSPSTLLRQGYGGFSSPSSSQQAATYSAKENKARLTFPSPRGLIALGDRDHRATERLKKIDIGIHPPRRRRSERPRRQPRRRLRRPGVIDRMI